MKAVITQREELDKYGCRIDVMESAYIRYFENIGLDIIPISNFTINMEKTIKDNRVDLIILSGGGSLKNEFYETNHDDFIQFNRDELELKIMKYSLKYNIPLLGICRGMQYMNAFFGGKISKLKNLAEDRKISVDHKVVLKDNKNIFVNNYHNDGIYKKNLSNKFDILALDSENDVVEAIYANDIKWLGFQWHPERNIDDEFSRNFIKDIIIKFVESGGILS